MFAQSEQWNVATKARTALGSFTIKLHYAATCWEIASSQKAQMEHGHRPSLFALLITTFPDSKPLKLVSY